MAVSEARLKNKADAVSGIRAKRIKYKALVEDANLFRGAELVWMMLKKRPEHEERPAVDCGRGVFLLLSCLEAPTCQVI